MTDTPKPGSSSGSIWTNERARGIVSQVLLVGGIIAVVWFLVSNTNTNLEQAGLELGFGFLADQAFFEINQNLIEYSSTSTFGRALLVGLLNTLLVSVLGIITATIVGFVMGVLRLSNNWMVSRMAGIYVEGTRNVPLLLQIIFWWTILTGLPRVADSLAIGNAVYLNNRGVRFPAPILEPGMGLVIVTAVIGLIVALIISGWASRRRVATGQGFPSLWVNLMLIFLFPVLLFLLLGRPLSFDVPVPGRFNFTGGMNVTPELVALWWALTLYTGSFIAE
ncbi:MAG: ABC transporter permease subunit, partial [Alphaproteobacteria bacterium]|nr:ABC transporter permease subunit [Alphaproteobacteria bacterium]